MTSLQKLSCIEECPQKKETLKRILFPDASDSPSTYLVFPHNRKNEPETKFTTFRQELVKICWSYLLTQQEYVIFFDKIDFHGRPYFLPLRPFIYEDNASLQTIFEQKVKHFIHLFRFYYRQTFSCVIPKRYHITFTSVEKTKPIFEINAGTHAHVFFALKAFLQKVNFNADSKIKID